MASTSASSRARTLPVEEDFVAKHPKIAQLITDTPEDAISSAVSTPASEMVPSSEVPSTPLNGGATPSDSEPEPSVATSTITTTISSARGSGSSTVEFKHIGAKGLSHRVGKDGAIHLKPVAASSRSRKKMRAVVSFKPRNSHFDRFNETSSRDQFRGFFTLFWVCLALFVLNTSYTSFASTGQVLSLTFATLFSRDAWMLALSDGVLISSLFICVPFANVCRRGWIRYWPTAVAFQHLWQATLLGLVIKWARYREWPWVQSGFFVLHTLAMMMKIHSYMTVNGNMADSYHRMRRIESMLEERVAEVEGSEAGRGYEQLQAAWRRAVRVARDAAGFGDRDTNKVTAQSLAEWSALDTQRGSKSQRLRMGQALNPSTADDEAQPPALEVHDASAGQRDSLPDPPGRTDKSLSREEHMKLHKDTTEKNNAERKASSTSTDKDAGKAEAALSRRRSASRGQSGESHAHQIRDPHPLSSHPDQLIADLAREIEVLREDLLSTRPSTEPSPELIPQEPVMWPSNVTYANFWDYLLVPTLVYELSYPRLKTIRPLYVLEKTLATFGTFLVIYVITEHWIMPFTPTSETPFLRTFLQLAVPMMINYLLIFYIMFECICNAFAELTRFADREFYLDWWNATSMDVFSRKWNKPVHSFLLRHVYASTIAAWGLSKSMAMFLTFLLSSLVHELVMAIVSGKIRFYLFAAQMVQLPLIILSQIPFIKRNETLGNMIFWIGLMAGFPLLNIGYLVY